MPVPLFQAFSAGSKRKMGKYYYDLHIHSCLSPCGDADMTPNNIAGMAALKGLDIIALTDHNTCANCPAFIEACEKNGIIGIPGMELTTSEEIHLVCLFGTLEKAMDFSELVSRERIMIKNKPEIFGEQLILDANDEVIGNEDFLLINATQLDLYSAVRLAEDCGGIVYPAHVDKQANGIIGILGTFPATPSFSCAEFSDLSESEALALKYPILSDCFHVCSSDAHYLWDISERLHCLDLQADTGSKQSDGLKQRILDILISGGK